LMGAYPLNSPHKNKSGQIKRSDVETLWSTTWL